MQFIANQQALPNGKKAATTDIWDTASNIQLILLAEDKGRFV